MPPTSGSIFGRIKLEKHMKTFVFSLLFYLVALFPVTGQNFDLPKAVACLDKCESFFQAQPYTPLPDSLALCLAEAVKNLKSTGQVFIALYLRSMYSHANQMANIGSLRQAANEFRVIDSILQSFPATTLVVRNIAQTQNQMSIVLMHLFELDEARLYNAKALANFEKGNLPEGVFLALVSKSVLAQSSGNISEGLYWAEQALAHWRTIPDIPPARRLDRLSAERLKYAYLLDLADSIAHEDGQQSALPQFRAALQGLQNVLVETTQYDSLSEDVKTAAASLVFSIQQCFSNLCAVEPAWADSVLRYQQYLTEKGVNAGNAVPYFGLTEALSALAYAEKGEWADAYRLSLQSCRHYGYPAFDIFYDKPLSPIQIQQIQEKYAIIQTLRFQARILQMHEGDLRAHRQALFVYEQIFRVLNELRLSFLSESSMELSTERFASIYHEAALAAIDLYRQSGRAEYFEKAFNYAEKGKSFALRSALRRRVEDNTVFEEERKLRDKLRGAGLVYHRNPNSAQLAILDSVYKEIQNLREKVKKNNPRYYSEQIGEDEVTLDLARQKLVNDDSTALIEFSVGNDSTLVMAITRSQTYWSVVKHPKNWSQTLNEYCQAIFTQNEDFAKGYDVYKVLLSEMLENRLPPQVDRLIIVPDGNLRKVLFESLLDKPIKASQGYDQLSYLLRRYALSYQYSLTAYKYAEEIKRNPTHSIGAFIGKYEGEKPTFLRCADHSIPHLANAARNATDMCGKKAEPFEAAAEADFMRQASQFDELFFAMHGCLHSSDPLESSILFTKDPSGDGRLTVSEVLTLPQNLNARLVVFGSCNTASGLLLRGEGIISLARAFAYAGVPATLATTAVLPDKKETSNLLTAFHQNLCKGMKKDRALAEAKSALMNEEHPYYWANFILIGDPAPMNEK